MTEQTKPAPVDLRPGDLLTDAEVAAMYGMSRITLANWRSTKRGPRFSRIGMRSVRYLRSDVEAFAQAGIVEPGAA